MSDKFFTFIKSETVIQWIVFFSTIISFFSAIKEFFDSPVSIRKNRLNFTILICPALGQHTNATVIVKNLRRRRLYYGDLVVPDGINNEPGIFIRVKDGVIKDSNDKLNENISIIKSQQCVPRVKVIRPVKDIGTRDSLYKVVFSWLPPRACFVIPIQCISNQDITVEVMGNMPNSTKILAQKLHVSYSQYISLKLFSSIIIVASGIIGGVVGGILASLAAETLSVILPALLIWVMSKELICMSDLNKGRVREAVSCLNKRSILKIAIFFIISTFLSFSMLIFATSIITEYFLSVFGVTTMIYSKRQF